MMHLLVKLFIGLFWWGLLIAAQVHAAANVSVAFVLDESGSMSSSDFLLETQGFISALNALPANGNIEVSLIGFASSTSVLESNVLLTSDGSNTLQQALLNNTKSGGSTYMGEAIETAGEILMNSSAPSKVICLATDGLPTNESNAAAAAASAKESGIVLAPIGVGLDSSGKSFLDSIASNPPVPNPVDFNEFGTVVRNVCIGVVQSALNIELTPDPVDFGVATGSLDQCTHQETIGVLNQSDKPAQISNVTIQGEDATYFKLVNVMKTPADNMTYPVTLPARNNNEIEVKIDPTQPPVGDAYNASLVVSGVDENGVTGEFTTALKAPLDISCLTVEVRDASPTIASINSAGTPLTASDNAVSVNDVDIALQNTQLERAGLVADGNARLFLTAKTSAASGQVRFEIVQPAQTEARLQKLDNSTNDSGNISVDIDIALNPDGEGQATAILRAGERFLGPQNVPEIQFEVRSCLLDSQDICTSVVQSRSLRERRAPVVLIHGLWGRDSREAFWANPEEAEDGKHGLWNALEQNETYYVGGYDYSDWLGPHETMPPNQPSLSYRINQLCTQAIENDDLACTRADLIGHSMGGLVARKYIHDNEFHKTENNYKQGSVRRLLTLGTPHLGSGLANLLTRDDGPIGSCIRRERLVVHDERLFGGLNVDENGDVQVTIIRTIAEGESLTLEEEYRGYEILESGLFYIQSLINILENNVFRPSRVAGAIDYLAVDNTDLNALNTASQQVWTSGFIGNIGARLALDNAGGDVLVRGLTYTGCSVDEIFQRRNTDGIVPVDSAQGRLGSATTEARGVAHLGMGKREGTEVVDWALEQLQIERNRFSETASYTTPKSAQVAESKSEETMPMFISIIKFIRVGIVSLFGITPAYAADIASLQLSVNDMTPSPGSPITFELTSSSGEIGVATLTSKKGDLNDHSAPFTWTIDIPNSAGGTYWYYATGFVDNHIVRSNSIVIEVVPMSILKDMVFEPGSRLVLYPGGEEQLSVIGRYSDGFNRDITSSAMGTTYTEKLVNGVTTINGDSPVFSVTSAGLVTAKLPGEAEIVATNSGVSVSRRILTVPASDTDADGDRLSDADETQFGTDKFNPDSDNDGVWDNIEYEEAQSEQAEPPPDDTAPLEGNSGGGGCAINPYANFDPILIILLLGAIGYIAYRRRDVGTTMYRRYNAPR